MNITSRRRKYYLSLFVNIATLLFFLEISQALDTINTSYILRDGGNDTVISSGGTFELGFYSPENSVNRYVGIWYKQITPRTVVWVANRDNPLTNTSGALNLAEPGILSLVNGSNGIVWLTNTSKDVQRPVAKLLDSGNLIVKDANDDDNPENFLWQSFDYPTDTFLAGMKLGVNFATGQEVYLTSGKSNGDPASGEFTYHCNPSGYPQNMIKRGPVVRYRTGPWNGLGFSGNPNLETSTIFTFGMVINENEVFYHYEPASDSVLTRFWLSESGVGQRFVWVERTQGWRPYLTIPIDNCDTYNSCGPHANCEAHDTPSCGCMDKFEPRDRQAWDSGDWASGCNRSTPLDCRTDGFLKYSNIKLPDTSQHSWYDSSTSLEECKDLCLNNCSCMAYASLNISRGGNGDGCLIWYGDLVDIREISTGQDIYIRMASSEMESQGNKRAILIVALSLAAGILVLCLISLFLYSRKRKKQDNQLPITGNREAVAGRQRLDNMDNYPSESQSEDLELPQFDFSTISIATNDFSMDNKLGQGGFGPVYKGRLGNGQEIAVKRLSRTSLQGVYEFKNEIVCIAKLQHRNLVKLLGCCIHEKELMLVYEYMANKSLNKILFDPMTNILLDWHTRFNIINGIARGLLYLHQDSRLRVIHRDLKTSNILLDSNMNPKISDFGLARVFLGNEVGANTSRIVGTYGYMSPEYTVDGLFSVKSDVFSYGVIMLEIISGKKNRGFTHRDHLLNLLGHAWVLHREGRSLELVDSCLENSCYSSEALRCIHIGLLCVQEHPENRPDMSSVVLMLSNDNALPEAKHPGFFTSRGLLPNEALVAQDATCSLNSITTSLLDAR